MLPSLSQLNLMTYSFSIAYAYLIYDCVSMRDRWKRCISHCLHVGCMNEIVFNQYIQMNTFTFTCYCIHLAFMINFFNVKNIREQPV